MKEYVLLRKQIFLLLQLFLNCFFLFFSPFFLQMPSDTSSAQLLSKHHHLFSSNINHHKDITSVFPKSKIYKNIKNNERRKLHVQKDIQEQTPWKKLTFSVVTYDRNSSIQKVFVDRTKNDTLLIGATNHLFQLSSNLSLINQVVWRICAYFLCFSVFARLRYLKMRSLRHNAYLVL